MLEHVLNTGTALYQKAGQGGRFHVVFFFLVPTGHCLGQREKKSRMRFK